MLVPTKNNLHSCVCHARKVGGFDDEGGALPVPTGITKPLANAVVIMRRIVDRDYSGIVDRFHYHDDISRCLKDVVVVVIETGRHGSRQPERNAAIE